MSSLLESGLTVEDIVQEAKILREVSRRLEAIVLAQTTQWCAANGIAPHPRLRSAAEYMSGAAILGHRSTIPKGKTREQVSREALAAILEAVNERDPAGIRAAILQIQEVIKSSNDRAELR